MTLTDAMPYVTEDGVELYPPDHVTVIGSTHIKGAGTTKTTNCMMSAFAFVKRGLRVRVVSFDREHSAVSWADKGYEGTGLFQDPKKTVIPWPDDLEVEGADSPSDLMELIHDYDGDIVMVDGSPADPESVRIVAAVCHIVVLPMEPGSLVLEQAPVTVALAQEIEEEQGRDIDVRVLLVRVQIATRVAQKTKEVLDGSGIPVMKVTIGDHTAIKEVAHQVPRRLFGWDAVVIELLGDDKINELAAKRKALESA